MVADHSAHRALRERGFDKVVPIQPLAAHGKKQVARLHGARIDGVSAGSSVGIDSAAGQHKLGSARKSQLHGLADCAGWGTPERAFRNASRASTMSSNGAAPALVT